MRVEPVSPQRLVESLVDRLVAPPAGHATRVLVDGPPPAAPGTLADALVAPLRARGRPTARVSARYFLRPASLRLEHGRHDPDAYLEDWLDAAALRREVLDPLGPGGSGRYLPSLWDPDSDRATRAERLTAPPGTVLLVDGNLLLGRGLPAETTVYLDVSPTVLARRTGRSDRWTLPAHDRYRAESRPLRTADVAVRYDDPRRPALVTNASS